MLKPTCLTPVFSNMYCKFDFLYIFLIIFVFPLYIICFLGYTAFYGGELVRSFNVFPFDERNSTQKELSGENIFNTIFVIFLLPIMVIWHFTSILWKFDFLMYQNPGPENNPLVRNGSVLMSNGLGVYMLADSWLQYLKEFLGRLPESHADQQTLYHFWNRVQQRTGPFTVQVRTAHQVDYALRPERISEEQFGSWPPPHLYRFGYHITMSMDEGEANRSQSCQLQSRWVHFHGLKFFCSYEQLACMKHQFDVKVFSLVCSVRRGVTVSVTRESFPMNNCVILKCPEENTHIGVVSSTEQSIVRSLKVLTENKMELWALSP